MQVGDKVILSDVGMGEYMDKPDNPHNTLGIISSDYDNIEFAVRVTWFNGKSNIYYRDELQVIKC